MKMRDKNKTGALVSALIFLLFLVAFRICSALVGAGKLPDLPLGRFEAVLTFFFFLPILTSLYFCGKYQTARGHRRIGRNLTFVGVALQIFSLLQILLALLGFYG